MSMGFLKGISVVLHTKQVTGLDDFDNPIVTDVDVTVDNVLVYPTATSDQLDEVSMSGKRSAYTLCIPKGDSYDWTNAEVEFWGERFRTIGIPKQYIEEMLPLEWNKQIEVERFE